MPLALDRDARTAMGRRARGAMINHAKWDDVFTTLADEYRAVARSRTLQAESRRLPVEMGVL